MTKQPRADWKMPEKPEETCPECNGDVFPRIDDSDDEGYWCFYWDCDCHHIGQYGWLIDCPFEEGQEVSLMEIYALGFVPFD